MNPPLLSRDELLKELNREIVKKLKGLTLHFPLTEMLGGYKSLRRIEKPPTR